MPCWVVTVVSRPPDAFNVYLRDFVIADLGHYLSVGMIADVCHVVVRIVRLLATARGARSRAAPTPATSGLSATLSPS